VEETVLHPRIRDILELYTASVDRECPSLLEGLYLYGSIALGDYSLALSDIDFIAVTAYPLQTGEITVLGDIHRSVARRFRKPEMNGIYVTWADIGRLPGEMAPIPYYHDRRMHAAGYFELNLVTWFQLGRYGIRIRGPFLEELDLEVDEARMIALMHENLDTYWQRWIDRAAKGGLSLPSLLAYWSKSKVEWGVLGITRLFYTFRERDTVSKAKAGEYAINVLPERWHRIVQECINVRRGVSKSLYRSNRERKTEAIAYMRYMMNACRALR